MGKNGPPDLVYILRALQLNYFHRSYNITLLNPGERVVEENGEID